MMSESEIRSWRNHEQERLSALVNIHEYEECKRTVMLLNAILGED